jgi:uncharacterized protein involved in exopolysaccharide biosynthesis
MPVAYRADVLLSAVSSQSGGGLSSLSVQLGGLAALAGVDTSVDGKKNENMATLSSRKLIESFIEQNKLLPVLYAEQWDARHKQWKAGSEKPPTIQRAVEQFRKEIWSVAEEKKTGLVTVAVVWHDPHQAADWANRLVKNVNETLRAQAIANSTRNLTYLNEKLEETSVVELRQTIFRLIESEVKNVMVAQGSEEFAFKVIDKAVVPEKPIKPRRGKIVVGFSLLGLLLACGSVLLGWGREPAATAAQL